MTDKPNDRVEIHLDKDSPKRYPADWPVIYSAEMIDKKFAALESEVKALKAREEYHQAEIDTLNARVEALEDRLDPKRNPR